MLWGLGGEVDANLSESLVVLVLVPWKNNQIEWEKSVSVEIPFPVSRVHAVNVSTVPQLQIKAPTLRRWGTKLAVAVDRPFFEAIGGPSQKPSQDLDEGDIIWLVPQISDEYQLEASHWEVLSLEDSSDKLLAAKTVKRGEFEEALRAKLQRLQGGDTP